MFFYHSVQNLSFLLSYYRCKYIIQTTVILAVVLYWCESRSLVLRDGMDILIYIQQDAKLHSLFYLETAQHVSGGTITHHQER